MSAADHVPVIRKGDPPVKRCRVDPLVAEELVELADVGAALEEMRRAGMPQGSGAARRHGGLDAGGARVPLDDQLEQASAYRAAVFARVLARGRARLLTARLRARRFRKYPAMVA
jgi:hypothetical protein